MDFEALGSPRLIRYATNQRGSSERNNTAAAYADIITRSTYLVSFSDTIIPPKMSPLHTLQL
jgi:hypothetical protein